MPEEFPPQPPAYVPPPAPASDGLPPNTAAAVAYLTFIPAIIFLVIEPYNKIPLVRFHSFQSIALSVVWIAIWIALTIVHTMLSFIHILACLTGLLFLGIYLVVFLAFFIAWLVCILKASKGEWYKLPVIGDFADKQARS